MDADRDFVARQYANLVAQGMDAAAARARVGDVLGAAAVDRLDGEADEHPPETSDTARRLTQAAAGIGASAPDTQAACIRSLAEARLLALDWWRPIRTFLLYIVSLLALAIAVSVLFATRVLVSFQQFDRSIGVHGAAEWILAHGGLRLFGPLVLMAIALASLAWLWFQMRRRLARLQPFAGGTRLARLYGRAGVGHRIFLCLEYASILREGGAPDDAVMEPAQRLAGWPEGTPLGTRTDRLGERLEQAGRLGTFAEELEWQRRLHWSTVQSQLEMSRDRLILFSRVVFYLLIGYLVTVLYLPIFSMASVFGAH